MALPRILVVDDDRHLAEMIQEYLQGNGYVVDTALDGMYAHSYALEHKPALIIMDVDMPMTDGLQALERLRADQNTQSIPVIMLTGVVSNRVFPVIENMPNVSHIKKPVHLEDLLSMVHHYIRE